MNTRMNGNRVHGFGVLPEPSTHIANQAIRPSSSLQVIVHFYFSSEQLMLLVSFVGCMLDVSDVFHVVECYFCIYGDHLS